MLIGPKYAVLFRAMIRHLVGALETERLGRGGAGHAELLVDRLILPPPQELVKNHDIPSSSHVRLGMRRIVKVRTFYTQLRQH